MTALAAAAVPVLAGTASAGLPAPVTLDGVGGVVPGMTVAQVSHAWGVRLAPRGGVSPECTTAEVRKGALGGSVLFQHGRFGAVWFDRGARTPSGIRIGSTREQLFRTYGRRLTFLPHTNLQSTSFYAFLRRSTAPHWRIRFDVRNGRVAQIGFGGRAVFYEEGCA